MSTADIFNHRWVSDLLTTGGQPTAAQLAEAAAEGFSTVINLATTDGSNALEDEAGLVSDLGMRYHHIPVVWNNPTDADFQVFEETMNQTVGDRTLLHCAANFRVTAFYSLFALRWLGWTTLQAEAFRAQIWAGSHYPIWDAFIDRKTREIIGGD